jgi:DNA-binding NtrC family response regulator
MKNLNVLAIDDEESILWILKEGLDTPEIRMFIASNYLDALQILNSEDIHICLVDIFLNDINGIELVKKWSKEFTGIQFIIMTAQNTSSNVIEAMKAGAIDFFQKPFDLEELKERILNFKSEVKNKDFISDDFVYDFQTENKEMLEIYKLIGRVAKTNISVLIQGETGTGKEIIARMIHNNSDRAHKPFVAINMAAVPKDLIESELFGYEKGAFTGAVNGKVGKFEEANGGTIFLDEISEMDMNLQSKLLRVIQEKELNRIGSSKTVKLDVRIVVASNRKLENEVSEGSFREDLFYRLNVVTITLPPLRERIEDLELLTKHFLIKYKDLKSKILDVEFEVFEVFRKYSWPGNIRELENVIQLAIVNCSSGKISVEDLPKKVLDNVDKKELKTDSLYKQLYNLARDIVESEILTENFNAYEEYVLITEKPLIKAVLDKTDNNKSLAAKFLGINRNTLRKKIKTLLN